jgi:hypothetical protein
LFQYKGGPVQLDIHPVLTKYLLKLEISESPDYDYGLPKEEMTSPAVYPHMHSLELEYIHGSLHIDVCREILDTEREGPVHAVSRQIINIEPFNDYPGAYVTVEDVLRAIREDLKSPLAKSEFHNFGHEERAAIRAAFNERCKTEEDLSKGPCMIDRLNSRNRLLILPKYPHDGALLPKPTLPPAGFL